MFLTMALLLLRSKLAISLIFVRLTLFCGADCLDRFSSSCLKSFIVEIDMIFCWYQLREFFLLVFIQMIV